MTLDVGDPRLRTEPQPEPAAAETEAEAAPEPETVAVGPAPPRSAGSLVAESERSTLLVSAAATLSAGAAALTVGGIFAGFWSRPVALLAVLLGAGLVEVSFRSGRRELQYLLIPAGFVAGALASLPGIGPQGVGALPSAIGEAIRTGGLGQPPVAFDPGWRVITIVLLTGLAGAAVMIGVGTHRPKLGVAVPIPVTIAAALLQPAGAAEVLGAVLGISLTVGGLVIAYGAELGGRGVILTSGFETRRLMRSAAIIAGLAVLVVVVSQSGFLFPQPQRNQVIPPQLPKFPPPGPDQVLFRVEMPRQLPVRLGVIDVYDTTQDNWLLPPYDTSRLQPLSTPGVLPGAPRSGATPRGSVTIQVATLGGHDLPVVPEAVTIGSVSATATFDPRTGNITLPQDRADPGFTYSFQIPPAPTGAQMAAAGAPPASMRDFMQAPPIPLQVQQLLATAPKDGFDRLQTLRKDLYSKVNAAGTGQPVPVSPSAVVAMLNGGNANPYAINEAEALLARWAGLPSRIGYGWYGGVRKGNWVEFHPINGAAWLEVWFKGYGWVPIVGIPPHAQSSIDQNQKNQNPVVQPSDEIALITYVPVRITTPLYYFEIAWYWVGLILPWLLAAAAVVALYPIVLKLIRLRRRRRWAARFGPQERIAIAYAELRDVCSDLAAGDVQATPLEFTAALAGDAQHRELAWLVTRAMWGDLRRDLHDEDVQQARDLSRSLIRRIVRAQNGFNLFLALIARTSLRRPYLSEIPNAWPWPAVRERLRAARQLLRRSAGRRQAARAAAAAAVVTVLALLAAGCGAAAEPYYAGPTTLPASIVPRSLGAFVFPREPVAETVYRTTSDALVSGGRVYAVEHGTYTEGSVQVSLLKQGLRVDDPAVLAGIDTGIGGAAFIRYRLSPYERVWVKTLPDERVYLWFPPHANVIEMVVVRNSFLSDKQLVLALVDLQLGRTPPSVPVQDAPPPPPEAASQGVVG